MNVISYLQFFDGLAEKNRGSFKMETRSRKGLPHQDEAFICALVLDEEAYRASGASRKEALRQLYRQTRKHQTH